MTYGLGINSPCRKLNQRGKMTLSVFLLGMGFITSGLKVRRGTVWYDHGEADVISEFALVKINTKLITDNEEHLQKLRFALIKFKGIIQYRDSGNHW